MSGIIQNGLKHDIDCTCQTCWKEFMPLDHDQNDTVELRTKKVVELAEQLGGFISYVQSFLETLPNYNQICDCSETKGLNFDEQYKDGQHRIVCCRCGGIIIEVSN